MTGQEIITQAEGFIDDTMDTTLEIQLLNNAKNKLERELRMEIHKKQDTSKSTTSGATYTTSFALPSDFRAPFSLYVGTTPYTQVPFSRSPEFRSTPNRYWIEMVNNVYRLCGTQGSPSQTITQTYLYKTTDYTEATINTEILTFPSEFHSIIAYEMAKIYYAIDGGDKTRSWDDRWTLNYQELKNAIIAWDADLKLAALDHSAYVDGGGTYDLGQL